MTPDRIEKKVLLRASRQRVWRALSDATEFGAWFGVRFDGPFAPGALLHGFVVPTIADPEVARKQKDYEGMPFDITVERMDAERLFSFRWHPFAIDPDVDYAAEPTTLVVFTLDEQEGGVLLTVTESGFDGIPLERRARAFQANEGGWALQVRMVEKYLARAA
jgi:uncharacterized protein YndB with AHSA1/START domain